MLALYKNGCKNYKLLPATFIYFYLLRIIILKKIKIRKNNNRWSLVFIYKFGCG